MIVTAEGMAVDASQEPTTVPGFCAALPEIELAKNTSVPQTSDRRRPTRSASRPPSPMAFGLAPRSTIVVGRVGLQEGRPITPRRLRHRRPGPPDRTGNAGEAVVAKA